MAIVPLLRNYNYSNSYTKSFNQISPYVDMVYVYDALDKPNRWTWYELIFIPEYLRLFTEYGDKLRDSDIQYNDYDGTEYVYPPTIEAGTVGYYSQDKECGWSYCRPFSEWYGNELRIYFKLIQHRLVGSTTQTIVLYFGDTEQYDTYFWTSDLYYSAFHGGLRVYFEIELL